MTTTKIHPFERAGLGKAPFRFDGLIQQDMCYGQVILNRAEYERTGIMLTTAPGGSCDYCGAYIVDMYAVKSSDGKRFKVGCDCIEKCYKESIGTDQERELHRLMKPVRDARNAKARARRAAKKAATKATLSASAEERHGVLLSRLDRAADVHMAFGRMAADLRAGKVKDLTERQLAWLEKMESELR